MIATIPQPVSVGTQDIERGEVFLNHFVEKWVHLRTELERRHPQRWIFLTDAFGPIGAEIEFQALDGAGPERIQPGAKAVCETYEIGTIRVRLTCQEAGEERYATGLFSKDREQFEVREINIAEMENIAVEEELFETLVYAAQRPFLANQCDFDEFLDWHPFYGTQSE